jgi:hypothetical protein
LANIYKLGSLKMVGICHLVCLLVHTRTYTHLHALTRTYTHFLSLCCTSHTHTHNTHVHTLLCQVCFSVEKVLNMSLFPIICLLKGGNVKGRYQITFLQLFVKEIDITIRKRKISAKRGKKMDFVISIVSTKNFWNWITDKLKWKTQFTIFFRF